MSINCELSSLLLEWYDRCARIMPWRDIHDPYKTWISEVMLQQTRVDTVIPYYNRFVSRFPTLSDLAAAEEKDVLKLWEGLGYYSRARNLLKGACQVMEQFGGVLPDDADKLKAIKESVRIPQEQLHQSHMVFPFLPSMETCFVFIQEYSESEQTYPTPQSGKKWIRLHHPSFLPNGRVIIIRLLWTLAQQFVYRVRQIATDVLSALCAMPFPSVTHRIFL